MALQLQKIWQAVAFQEGWDPGPLSDSRDANLAYLKELTVRAPFHPLSKAMRCIELVHKGNAGSGKLTPGAVKLLNGECERNFRQSAMLPEPANGERIFRDELPPKLQIVIDTWSEFARPSLSRGARPAVPRVKAIVKYVMGRGLYKTPAEVIAAIVRPPAWEKGRPTRAPPHQ